MANWWDTYEATPPLLSKAATAARPAIKRTPRQEKTWEKALKSPDRGKALRDTPELQRARVQPNGSDYIASGLRSIGAAPRGVYEGVTQVLPAAAGMARDYIANTTPGQALSDAGGVVSALGKHIAEHPVSSFIDALPVAGDIKGYAEMIGEAAQARAAVEEALSLVPPRPAYSTAENGPFLHVKREGAEPQLVPEAAGASLAHLREILGNLDTNQPARVADEYTREALGKPYNAAAPVPGTSLRKQAGIGAAFREMAEENPAYKSAIFERYGETMPEVVERSGAQNYDQLTEAAYRQLAKETRDQFDRLPVSTSYHYGEGEYPTPSAMLQDVLARGNLNVYRGGDYHPFLSDIDPATGLSANEMFRAAHDYFGHGTRGSTFRAGGEEAAYASHAGMMSPLARMALLAETRGQNSLVNYSPLNADLSLRMNQLRDEIAQQDYKRSMGANFGLRDTAPLKAELRELGAQTRFAPQTPGLLPPEYLDPFTEGRVPEYLKGVIKPRAAETGRRGVHLSRIENLRETDPQFYGSGHRGDDWYTRSADTPLQTSFYLGERGNVYPEGVVAAVNPHAYETTLPPLYDLKADREGLGKLAAAYNLKDTRFGKDASRIADLSNVLQDYGYSGYLNPDFMGEGAGAANVFDRVGGLTPITRVPGAGYAKGGLVE